MKALLIATVALAFIGTAQASSFALTNQRLAVGDTHGYSLDCPCENTVGWVQWDKTYDPKKDLAVDVTLPDGTELNTYNDPLNAKQVFVIGNVGPGTLLIDVTNVGTKQVRYDIEYGSSDSFAVAAKPADASITLNESDPDLGEVVTFTYTVPKKVREPRIEVTCYQDDVLVYGSAAEAYQQVLLGGGNSDWLRNGGPADCTAVLYYWQWQPTQQQVILATTTFEAGG